MTNRTEIEKRLAALEKQRSGGLESTITLELPPRQYEPAYPANPRPTLFREVLDTTPSP